MSEQWWKETADRHERLQERTRWTVQELNDIDPGNTFEPSLVTGRCRCKACRAAREAERGAGGKDRGGGDRK